jgi:hypothetical protein
MLLKYRQSKAKMMKITIDNIILALITVGFFITFMIFHYQIFVRFN